MQDFDVFLCLICRHPERHDGNYIMQRMEKYLRYIIYPHWKFVIIWGVDSTKPNRPTYDFSDDILYYSDNNDFFCKFVKTFSNDNNSIKLKLSNRSWRTIALVSLSRTKGREVNPDLENVSQISGITFS